MGMWLGVKGKARLLRIIQKVSGTPFLAPAHLKTSCTSLLNVGAITPVGTVHTRTELMTVLCMLNIQDKSILMTCRALGTSMLDATKESWNIIKHQIVVLARTFGMASAMQRPVHNERIGCCNFSKQGTLTCPQYCQNQDAIGDNMIAGLEINLSN